MTSSHFASSSRVVNLIRSTMVLALFRTESDQRINCPIRTNTQRFCLARAVHYQPAPHHPGTRQEPFIQARLSIIKRLWLAFGLLVALLVAGFSFGGFSLQSTQANVSTLSEIGHETRLAKDIEAAMANLRI